MSKQHISYSKHRPHPWHGIDPIVGERGTVRAFIEITPKDPIKFEIDPATGYLFVDRPQRNSSLPPSPYGFIPQTMCGKHTARLMGSSTDGDGDALDICVLSENDLTRSEVVLTAYIIGALKTRDSGKEDPKIIGVLAGDLMWGKARDLSEIPSRQLDRLEHYFRQYKVEPDNENPVTLEGRCSRDEAIELFDAAKTDYKECFL